MFLLHNYDVAVFCYLIILLGYFNSPNLYFFKFYYINSYYDARYSKAEKFI